MVINFIYIFFSCFSLVCISVIIFLIYLDYGYSYGNFICIIKVDVVDGGIEG